MFPTLSPKSSCKVCLQQYWEGVHRDYDHSPLSYIHLRCGSISRAGFEHHHGGSEARNPLQAWGTTICTNSDHKTSFHCRNVFQTLLGAQELQHSIDITRYALHYACINAFKTQKHSVFTMQSKPVQTQPLSNSPTPLSSPFPLLFIPPPPHSPPPHSPSSPLPLLLTLTHALSLLGMSPSPCSHK